MKKRYISRMLFYLFSIVCVGGCFWLYVIRTGQNDDVLHTEAEPDIKQQNTQYEVHTDDVLDSVNVIEEIRADLNKHLTEKENELYEIEEKTQRLQMQYQLQALLESKSNAMKDDNPNSAYEKYLRLRQGELARICGIEDMSENWRTGDINSHFSRPAILIDNNLYVQYRNLPGIYEYALPGNILVTGSDVDLGFMDARAGMNFQEIWENAYEEEIQEGFMYTEDIKVYFVEYMDGLYDYIYYSNYPDGKDTWLIIRKK